MASLVAIFNTIFFVSQGRGPSDDDRRRDNCRGGGGSQNKGAVTGERLAPFCDDAPEPSMSDEDLLGILKTILPPNLVCQVGCSDSCQVHWVP